MLRKEVVVNKRHRFLVGGVTPSRPQHRLTCKPRGIGECADQGGRDGRGRGKGEHDQDLVANGFQWVGSGDDHPGHRTGQLDQADGFHCVKGGDHACFYRSFQHAVNGLLFVCTQAEQGFDFPAGSLRLALHVAEEQAGDDHRISDNHACDRDQILGRRFDQTEHKQQTHRQRCGHGQGSGDPPQNSRKAIAAPGCVPGGYANHHGDYQRLVDWMVGVKDELQNVADRQQLYGTAYRPDGNFLFQTELLPHGEEQGDDDKGKGKPQTHGRHGASSF